jgi:hypothetical protein
MIGVGKMNQTCLCGSIAFDRVKVDRPDGSQYVTAFLACCRCGVMYHRPPRPEPPASPPSKRPLIMGRDAASQHVSTLTPEEKQELMESVRRANTGKRKGLRG